MADKTIKGKTATGFAFEISQDRMQNYELVEAISEVDTNPLVLPRLIKLLLGDQAEALKNHVRTEDGIVPLDKMGDEIKDIFASQDQLKK